MKTIKLAVAAAGAAVALAGCATDGLSTREVPGADYPNYILSLPSSGTSAPRGTRLPVRLAVAQVGEAAPPAAMLEQLTRGGALVSSTVGLPLPGDRGYSPRYDSRGPNTRDPHAERIKAACALARAAGADHLFIFGGEIDSWRQRNSLSILDVTLIGAVVAPGSRIHVDGKAAGALVDAATGEPVLFVGAEAHDSALSPDELVGGNTEAMRARLRDQLAEKLSDDLLRRLASMNSPTAPNPTSIGNERK